MARRTEQKGKKKAAPKKRPAPKKKAAPKKKPAARKKTTPKKKPAARKKPAPRRRRPKKPSLSGQLFRVAVGLTVLVALVAAAGYLVHEVVRRPAPVSAPTVQAPEKGPAPAPPPFEIYPEKDLPVRPPTAEKKPMPAAGLPKVALIIDDLGYDRKMAEQFMSLDAVMTASILPHAPVADRIARMARDRGWEIMLHLPMEPNEYPKVNPGPGALLTTMGADELIAQLNANIDSIPSVRGINNHMGSKMTTRSTQLYQVFSILKKRNLYFIDSRTTADTVGKASARLFQLRFAERDVFIDHLQDRDFIRRQIDRLIETAESHGEAIGIAHPHDMTAQILREMLPELKKRVQLVPASEVVHPLG